jgi:hypothetical protein
MEELNLAPLRLYSGERVTRRIGRTWNLATEPRSDGFRKEMGRMNANSWWVHTVIDQSIVDWINSIRT